MSAHFGSQVPGIPSTIEKKKLVDKDIAAEAAKNEQAKRDKKDEIDLLSSITNAPPFYFDPRILPEPCVFPNAVRADLGWKIVGIDENLSNLDSLSSFFDEEDLTPIEDQKRLAEISREELDKLRLEFLAQCKTSTLKKNVRVLGERQLPCALILGGSGSVYAIGQLLGFGIEGRVNIGINLDTKQKCVIKIVRQGIQKFQLGIEPHEMRILAKLNRLKDTIYHDTKIYIVQEKCEGSQIFSKFMDMIEQRLPFDNKTLIEICKQSKAFLTAVIQLHIDGVLHLDIHEGNALYSERTDEVSLIDFSSAVICNSQNPNTKEEFYEGGWFPNPQPKHFPKDARDEKINSEKTILTTVFDCYAVYQTMRNFYVEFINHLDRNDRKMKSSDFPRLLLHFIEPLLTLEKSPEGENARLIMEKCIGKINHILAILSDKDKKLSKEKPKILSESDMLKIKSYHAIYFGIQHKLSTKTILKLTRAKKEIQDKYFGHTLERFAFDCALMFRHKRAIAALALNFKEWDSTFFINLTYDYAVDIIMIYPRFSRHVILINYESTREELGNDKVSKKVYKRI